MEGVFFVMLEVALICCRFGSHDAPLMFARGSRFDQIRNTRLGYIIIEHHFTKVHDDAPHSHLRWRISNEISLELEYDYNTRTQIQHNLSSQHPQDRSYKLIQ